MYLYSWKKPAQNWRAWAREANEDGNSGRYFRVLNCASEYGLSPTVPIEASAPASASRFEYRIEVYWPQITAFAAANGLTRSMGYAGICPLTGQCSRLGWSATRRAFVVAGAWRGTGATCVVHGNRGCSTARGTRRRLGAGRRRGCAVRPGRRVPGASAGSELLPEDGPGLRV